MLNVSFDFIFAGLLHSVKMRKELTHWSPSFLTTHSETRKGSVLSSKLYKCKVFICKNDH